MQAVDIGGNREQGLQHKKQCALLPHFAPEEVQRAEQEGREGDRRLAAGLAHAEELHQIVHAGPAHKAGPVPDLDAVDGVLRPHLLAVDAAVPAGGVALQMRFPAALLIVALAGLRAAGVDGGAGFPGTGRLPLMQRHTAVFAPLRAGSVVGAAVGAHRILRVGAATGGFGMPLKTGGVLRLMQADAGFLPACPVVGGAAVRADHHIVIVLEFFTADGAGIANI